VFEYECHKGAAFPKGLHTTVIVRDYLGQPVFMLSPQCTGSELPIRRSKGRWSCSIESLPLLPDSYTLLLWFGVGQQDFDWIENAANFEVIEGDFFGSGYLMAAKHKFGPVMVRQDWRAVD
jgi:hypothetical protein